jgi:hypothetical protein
MFLCRALQLTGLNMKTENEITVVLIKEEGNKLLDHIPVNNFLCKYSIKQFNHHVFKHSLPEIHEVNIRTLTERHVITFRKQFYQPVRAILVKLLK